MQHLFISAVPLTTLAPASSTPAAPLTTLASASTTFPPAPPTLAATLITLAPSPSSPPGQEESELLVKLRVDRVLHHSRGVLRHHL